MSDEEKGDERKRCNSLSQCLLAVTNKNGRYPDANVSEPNEVCDGNVGMNSDNKHVTINGGSNIKEDGESKIRLSNDMKVQNNIQQNILTENNDNAKKLQNLMKLKKLSSSKRNIGKAKKHAKDLW